MHYDRPAGGDSRWHAALAELRDQCPADVLVDIADWAAALLQCSLAAVTVLDSDGEWVAASSGGARHAALDPEITRLARASDEAVIVSADAHRFSAGAVVRDPEGVPIGVLHVASDEKRELSAADRELLSRLGRHVTRVLTSRFEAARDPLTGLLLRRAFARRVRSALAADASTALPLMVAVIDIDGFTLLNAHYGSDVADQVLCTMASRLNELTGATGFVGRVGGGVFAAARAMDDLLSPNRWAEQLRTAFVSPIVVDHQELAVTATVAVAFAEVDSDLDTFSKLLEGTLHDAKQQGGNAFAVVDGSQRPAEATMAAELHRAIAQQELRVHYQPIVAMASGAVEAVEALVRWEREPGVLIEPHKFLPLANRTGLIMPIGAWAIGHACDEIAEWNAQNPDSPLRLNLNLSARQLSDRAIVGQVLGALESSGLDPESLTLEVSERSVTNRPETTLQVLTELRHHGIRLSIDDFGTGYSSLAWLQQFPADELKIDASFIGRIHESDTDATFVRTIMYLARSLGLETVAEGVERADQHEMLLQLRCNRAQGWLYARPSEHLDKAVLGAAEAVQGANLYSFAKRQTTGSLWSGESQATAAQQVPSAFTHASVGMTVIDGTGTQLKVNPTLCRLVGRDPSELVGRSCWEFVHHDDVRVDQARMHRLLRGEVESYVLEERYVAADGTEHWVEVTVGGEPSDDLDDDAPVRLLRQVRSIEDRRAAQAALAEAHAALTERADELMSANERLSQFASALTHDLAQPLSALGGFLSLLHDYGSAMLDDDARVWLERAMANQERLVTAVAGLFTTAAADDVAVVPVDVAALVNDTLERLNEPLRQSGATVHVDELPPVLAAPAMLTQAIENVVANACRYRDPERPLQIVIDAVAAHDGHTTIRITDNGIGIDPEDREQVFEHKVRGRNSEHVEGSGIGLTTVRTIVTRLEGCVWIEAAPEHGTRVCLQLRSVDAAA